MSGPSGDRIFLTVSIGVGCSAEAPVTPEALLNGADTALYAAKHAGHHALRDQQPFIHGKAQVHLVLLEPLVQVL